MDFLNNLLLSNIANCLILGLTGYNIALLIYRLWLSPLSRFPGSPLAKATFWYEFYYDWVKPGQYYHRIHEMHKIYGPIIRITPNELHISDPSCYAKLFVTGAVRKSDSYPGYADGTGFEDYAAMIHTHDDHRSIRAPAQQYFSVSSLGQIEIQVVNCIKTLCQRLEGYRDINKPFNMSYALLALSTDTISTVLYEEPTNALAEPNFNKSWFKMRKQGMGVIPLLASIPWPARASVIQLLELISSYIQSWHQSSGAMLQPPKGVKEGFGATDRAETSRKQFGQDIYKRGAQLVQESGIYHLSHTLHTIITHLALNDDLCQALRNELKTIAEHSPESPSSWQDLQKLPYLDACIKEGLRMATGSQKRSTRVFPNTMVSIKGRTVPKGTPVSMSTYWMHMDPEVYVDPHKFRPNRWLGFQQNELIAEYFVPFGKGSRNCIGKNFAQMVMYHTLQELYRPGAPSMQLFETDGNDVVPTHGYLFPLPSLDSEGVRLLVHGDGA
ncbi:cytochrome P450 [Aspergillus pseudoustus]|uniref:Cytochrome P450 n=1 Tax=Aspergillus pseudoustus TaxID=1810923 RepID=A0ABR4JDP9_9EURO